MRLSHAPRTFTSRRLLRQLPSKLLWLQERGDVLFPSLGREVGLCRFLFRHLLINNLMFTVTVPSDAQEDALSCW